MTGCTCNKFVPGESYVPGRDCPTCWQQYHIGSPQPTTAPAYSTAPRRSIWRAFGQALSYAEAVLRWKLAGSPVTPPEELEKRKATCAPCPFFNPVTVGCKVCGCGQDGGSLEEKWRMATESCPDEPPRWTACFPPASPTS